MSGGRHRRTVLSDPLPDPELGVAVPSASHARVEEDGVRSRRGPLLYYGTRGRRVHPLLRPWAIGRRPVGRQRAGRATRSRVVRPHRCGTRVWAKSKCSSSSSRAMTLTSGASPTVGRLGPIRPPSSLTLSPGFSRSEANAASVYDVRWMILSTTCVSGPMVMMIFGTSSFVRCRRMVRSRSVLLSSDSLARCWSSRRFNLSWSNPKTKASANRSMNPRKFLGPPQFVAGRGPVGSGVELRSVRFACPSPDRASTLQTCENSHVWLHRHR